MRRCSKASCFAAAAAFFTSAALAQRASAPSSVFVQAGTVGITKSASVGVTSEFGSSWALGSTRLGGYWEGSVAEWSYPAAGGRRTQLTQFAVKPVARLRLDHDASPWFIEAGIGLTLTNRQYVSAHKTFSTRFNFGDHLAVGRAFGAGAQHELALRVEHFSNGGIREPNPGETFLQLRYAYRFP